MSGFLGTRATLWSDLSLVLTWLFGAIAAYGGIQAHRRRFSRHCPVMPMAALLNWVPVLAVMIPTLVQVAMGEKTLTTGLLAVTPIVHAGLGAVTQMLMTYTAVRMRWVERLPPDEPIWLMRTTLGLWLLTLLGGTLLYVVSYVL